VHGNGKSPQQLNEITEGWKSFIKSSSDQIPHSDKNPWLLKLWPPQPIITASTSGTSSAHTQLAETKISLPEIGPESPHSMQAVEKYVENRIGPWEVEAIRDHKVKVLIYAGTADHANAFKPNESQNYLRIPCLFENFGIEKFLDMSPVKQGEKPRLLIKIPPTLEYANHYAALLKVIGADIERVIINQNDRQSYRESISEATRKIKLQIDNAQSKPISYAGFGYYSHWEKALKDPKSPWKLKISSDYSDGHLIQAKVLHLQHKNFQMLQPRVLLLESKSSRFWGEGSAFVAEAVLRQNPNLKGFIFMGSAGSLSANETVNGVSVPKSFKTSQGSVDIENSVYQTALELKSPKAGNNKSRIHKGANHGHTASPAEQTLAYTSKLVEDSIDTIDVEQSLVAKAIRDYNQSTTSAVRFAAINIITDKPASKQFPWATDENLDHVNSEAKAIARGTALNLMLRTIEDQEFISTVCSSNREILDKASPTADYDLKTADKTRYQEYCNHH
jgi:hypothetical protein